MLKNLKSQSVFDFFQWFLAKVSVLLCVLFFFHFSPDFYYFSLAKVSFAKFFFFKKHFIFFQSSNL